MMLPRFLPWAIALASPLVLLSSRSEPPSGTVPAPATLPAIENETLRLALVSVNRENAALRRELDRFLEKQAASVRPRSEGRGHLVAARQTTFSVDEVGRQTELLNTARSALASGARTEAEAALSELSKAGAWSALRDFYLSTEDPRDRRFIIGPLLFGGDRDEGLEFFAGELQNESDPGLRAALLAVASEFVTAKTAPAFQASLLAAAERAGDPALRAAAIRGLRFSKGADVERALFAAATSAHEDVRLAAFEQLAAHRGTRDQARELLAAERSNRVRELGECRLLIATGGAIR